VPPDLAVDVIHCGLPTSKCITTARYDPVTVHAVHVPATRSFSRMLYLPTCYIGHEWSPSHRHTSTRMSRTIPVGGLKNPTVSLTVSTYLYPHRPS
jgi:hypothetical protein